VYLPPNASKWIQALFVIRDRDLWWFQAMPQVWLEPGKWQTIRIDISPTSVEWKARNHMKAWDGYTTQAVRLFGVRFFSSAAYQGQILLDNVRLVRQPGPGRGPAFQQFSVSADEVGVHEKFEITFVLSRAYANPFDPQVANVVGHFACPSGPIVRVPGFFSQDYHRQRRRGGSCLVPTGGGKWKVRFTPTEVGRHDYWVQVRDGRVTTTRRRSFHAAPSQRPGFVRVSKRDPRYFELSTGEFYYPIGHNVHAPYDSMYGGFRHTSLTPTGDLDNYERVFAQMADNGENFVEVWMSAWWLALEWNPKHNFFHGLGRYNLQNAWKLDRLLDMAERYGIRVHLVVQNHGMLSLWCDSEWADNPYNKALGGMLDSPEEFFTNPTAMDYVQKKMRYIIARWGYATHLFGIELISELDLTGEGWSFVGSPTKITWHDRVTRYIRSIDPNQHLLTTHYSSGYYREDPKLVSLPGIDYTVTDGYRADQAQNKDIVQVINDTYTFNARFGKPTFITEFGGRNAVESPHVLEMDLHCGLWASYVSPTGATPLFWWFHFLEDESKYFHYRALAAFDGGLDRRGLKLEPASVKFAGDKGLLRAQCIVGPSLALLWVYERDLPREKRNFRPIRGASAAFAGLRPGRYRVEFWDTRAGRITHEGRVEVGTDPVTLPLPDVVKDVACKVLSIDEPPLDPRPKP